MAYLWFYFVATLIRVDAARALLSTSFGGSRRRVFTALPVRVSAECFFNARDQIGGQRARRRPRRRALLSATSRVFLRKTRLFRLKTSSSVTVSQYVNQYVAARRHRDARRSIHRNTRLLDVLCSSGSSALEPGSVARRFWKRKKRKKNETRRLGAVSVVARSGARSVVVPSRVGSPVPACLPAGTSLSRATSGQVPVHRLDLRRIVRAEAAGDEPRLRRRHEVRGVCVAHRAPLAHLFVQGLQNALDDIGRGIVLRGRVPVPGRAVQRPRRLHQDAKQLLLHVLHLGQAVQELRDLQLGVLRGREERGERRSGTVANGSAEGMGSVSRETRRETRGRGRGARDVRGGRRSLASHAPEKVECRHKRSRVRPENARETGVLRAVSARKAEKDILTFRSGVVEAGVPGIP